MSKQTYRVCLCFRRRFRLTAAEAPPDVRLIFSRYSENGVMSSDLLRRFLVEVQGEGGVTADQVQGIMDGHEMKHLHSFFHRRGLTLEAFFKWLFAGANSPLDSKIGVHHDMTAPLSHYFICTSHNTYLTGNQLSSDSSETPIIRALQAGVRGIELDMWPNSSKDNVDIKHGRTLTMPVELIKCLRSIKEHAFTASEYPVIITLEDHLTADLQALAAEMITQTFGDILFCPGRELTSKFPSPESLKRRIIISTKPPVETRKVEVQESNSEKIESSTEDEAWRRETKPSVETKKLEVRLSNSEKIEISFENEVSRRDTGHYKQTTDSDKDDELEEPNDSDEENDEEEKSQQQVSLEYRNLIAIPAGKAKGKLHDWLRVDSISGKRLSLSEIVFGKAIPMYGKEIIRFTQQNLLRVYPKAIRVDSSNFNPLNAWMHGAQMVALNMQGYGKSLWLMLGMFRANGGCGYVKKPDFLLKFGPDSELFEPGVILPVKTTLKVTIYMGEGWYYDFSHTHFDSYSPPDLFARVGIAGVTADKTKKKTKTAEDSWIPTWDEVFEFPLTTPELALLRIEIREDDPSGKGKLAGQTCLPVWELRKGIRAIPLYNRKGVKYKCVKLLMRFEFV